MEDFHSHASLDFPAADWRDLSLSLIRIYEGIPAGVHGSYTVPAVSLWHMLRGNVRIEKEGAVAHAVEGDWLACLPGVRFQTFSKSARILSIHLVAKCPLNHADWSGPPLAVFPSDQILSALVRKLRAARALKGLSEEQKLYLEVGPQRLPAVLELRESTAAFFRRLTEVLLRFDIRFEPKKTYDARVQESLLHLASWNFRKAYSRSELAKQCGLSASQFDRIWREEMGITSRQYWEKLRLEAVCARLHGKENSIKEIAYEAGFKSLSQFSLWFRSRQGESPRTFRQRHRLAW